MDDVETSVWEKVDACKSITELNALRKEVESLMSKNGERVTWVGEGETVAKRYWAARERVRAEIQKVSS